MLDVTATTANSLSTVLSAAVQYNMALGRPAWQSTTRSSTNEASCAVDGNRDPVLLHGSCSHTAAGDNAPWWVVDLGQLSRVEYVEVTNRADSYRTITRFFILSSQYMLYFTMCLNYSQFDPKYSGMFQLP